NFVGQVGELRFERRPQLMHKALSHVAQPLGLLYGAMLEDAFPRLEAQVQSVEQCVTLLQHIDHAQRLQVVLEAAMGSHAFVECILAGMSERGVPQIVRQSDCLREILVQAQSARDGASYLCYFQAVRQARAKVVAFVIDENLGLVLQAAEGGGVDDAIAVALELVAKPRRFFTDPPPARRSNGDGVWSQFGHVSVGRHGCAADQPAQRSMRSPSGEPSHIGSLEDALQRLRRKLRSYESGSDTLQEHEAQAPLVHFLVEPHQLE